MRMMMIATTTKALIDTTTMIDAMMMIVKVVTAMIEIVMTRVGIGRSVGDVGEMKKGMMIGHPTAAMKKTTENLAIVIMIAMTIATLDAIVMMIIIAILGATVMIGIAKAPIAESAIVIVMMIEIVNVPIVIMIEIVNVLNAGTAKMINIAQTIKILVIVMAVIAIVIMDHNQSAGIEVGIQHD